MNLYEYLDKNLSRKDTYPAIDHAIRARKCENGDIKFYIHASGRDSDTIDFVVSKDGQLSTLCSATCGCEKSCG